MARPSIKVGFLNKNPTDKEKRYCKKIGLEILDAGVEDLLATVLN